MTKKMIIILALSTIAIGVLLLFVNREVLPPKDLTAERCEQENAPYLNSELSVEERVEDLLARMTEWEKIGQMVLIEKNSIRTLSDIQRYNIGALLSGGGAGPKINNEPLSWLQMISTFQAEAQKTCLKIPLLYGIDAVHGHANVLGATVFPHLTGLSATNDADLVRRVAEATAEEMAATGIYWNFAPNLDVVKDIRWGKAFETFGSDTARVSRLGVAYIHGLQDSSTGYYKVLANPKHYIGGGSMEYGTSRNEDFQIEEGNITLTDAEMRRIHLVPFANAIDEGARVIMVSTASWNGIINAANPYLLTDVLKGELGFTGFVVSDWYGVYQVAPTRYESLVTTINAGIDMVMTPFEYKDFMSNMQQAVANGDISNERLDDAVRRILRVKFETGLFDRPEATPEGLSVIGSAEHHTIALEAVRKSQVLLKNTKATLPLPVSVKKLVVSGASANNLGRQAGGWTSEWQGIDGDTSITGTTILEGIKETVSADTIVEYNQNGDFAASGELADIGIVVVGEKPYAEGWGDNPNPSLSPEDLSAIEKTKAVSKKLVVVIVSGRPLDISAYSEDWDAIVASWLPGAEGGGVADVLFGLHPFIGTLPFSWEI
ncbi:glycoside hydrolase family 3 C-terminal domain-containing protein [Candidatus Nomurabacteria bacterium]|nr:glycoside hydrolase family 3 C-terminal domain-containing protein [Candidatus Nomurabacteria bacterium]MCB9819223.1 glycoside hydrolase family 3 C-terminal domain-containing protein [Candidatus Nomurabacteria bacterium]